MSVSRRTLLTTSAAAALSPLATPHVARADDKRTLRFVPQANLSTLDPIWTTAAVTITHGYCVFDTLFGVNARLKPLPQMAEGATVSEDGRTWLVTLRGGLTFHDDTPVRAIDCAASLERWSKRDTFGQTLAAAVDRFEAADDRTLRVRLKRPFPRLLEAIGKPHSSPAFIMPERLARTDPMKQVTEMVGSGPFRFKPAEYVSGAKAVYERFEGYVPRAEAPDWTSGGKNAQFDRLEWVVMPDAATAAAALQRGEIDWWEQALPDLVPLLQRSPGIRLQQQDPYGFIAFARFNSTQPPFSNAGLRRAVLSAINQDDYMQSIMGANKESYRECRAMFPCGMPGVKEVSASRMAGHDLDRARAAVKAAGYAGEKTVVINPTDYPVIGPHGQVTAELLRALGFNVDLQEMDWGSVLQRRLSKEAPERGGWSIYHTNWPSVSIANPALNTTIRGDGSWAGWYVDAPTEQLTGEWLDAVDPAKQQSLLDAIQDRALDQAPSLPLGQFFVQTAFRDNLQGVRNGSVCYFWNVSKA
jgi:peptide/nickel transport system substrate-binding protein